MQELERTLIDWLPARDFTYDRQSFKRALMAYKDVTVEDLRANLIEFVREIAAVAEEEGARLAIHPDDPAFPIFGLPRVMSTAEDVRKLFQPPRLLPMALRSAPARSAPAPGTMSSPWRRSSARAYISRICETSNGSPTARSSRTAISPAKSDMVRLVAALMAEEDRRRAEGRADAEIPMRPDHGHLLGDDGKKRVNPGYSFIGRLKGLGELRGVMQTVEAFRAGRVA